MKRVAELCREIGEHSDYTPPVNSVPVGRIGADDLNALFDCGVGVRDINVLERMGISRIEQIAELTERQMKKSRGVGKATMEKMRKVLTSKGLTFRPEHAEAS